VTEFVVGAAQEAATRAIVNATPKAAARRYKRAMPDSLF
jgi:hypothetical protein